jgi:hypothetical protein
VARCGYCGAIDLHSRLDAAKAALRYDKPRLQAVMLANGGEGPLKVRSELEIGRRLAFVRQTMLPSSICTGAFSQRSM